MKKRFTYGLALLGIFIGSSASAQNLCVDTIKRVDAISTGGATDYEWLNQHDVAFHTDRKTMACQRVIGLSGDVVGVTFDAQLDGVSSSVDLVVSIYSAAAFSENKPSTQIGTTTATVTVDGTQKTYVATFPSPINLSANGNGHFIVIDASGLSTQDSVKLFCSKQGESDGNNWYNSTWWKMGSSFRSMYWTYNSYTRDFLIRPIVSFDVTPSFTTDIDGVCTGGDIQFTQAGVHPYLGDNLFNQDLAKAYEWNFGDGTPLNSVDQDPLHTFNAASNMASLTSTYTGYTNTCMETTTKTIYAGDPVADFNLPDNSSLTVDFTDASIGGGNWTWSFGDGTTDNTQNPNHVYGSNGSYDIKLVVDNGDASCADSITKTMVFSVGIIEEGIEKQIALFPNPAQNEINIDLTSVSENTISFEIYNILGEIVISEKLNATSINTINIEHLTEGKYIFKLSENDKVVTKSFVKI